MAQQEQETLNGVRGAGGGDDFLFQGERGRWEDNASPLDSPNVESRGGFGRRQGGGDRNQFLGEIDPTALFYLPDYGARYVDRSYVTEDGTFGIGSLLFGSLPSLLSGGPPTWNPLGIFAEIARLAGNNDASQTLSDFIWGNGQQRNLPVDRMLLELPRFSSHIVQVNETSIVGLLQGQPTAIQGNYAVYQTVSGIRYNTDIDGDGIPDQVWSRIGQQSTGANSRDSRANSLLTGLYAPSGINTSPDSADFGYMYNGSTPTRYSRAEFDWFIAINAFDYTISQVIVVDQRSGEAQLHYQVNVADEYAWYPNEATGLVDSIMGGLDMGGLGEPYELRGTSSVISMSFNVNDQRVDDAQGLETGTPGQPYYQLTSIND